MSHFLKNILWLFSEKFFLHQASKLSVNKYQKIYVFDIDNTLANTWPSLLVKYEGESERLLSLAVFIGMRNIILDLVNAKEEVMFISSRSILQYFNTKKWLKSIGLPSDSVLIVKSPIDKIKYLNILLKKRDVVFIDDLSFGHETGKVDYYKNEIQAITSLPLQYINCEVIAEINEMQKKSL